MEGDYPVHFRYHDAVNALIGNHHYRYERIRQSEVPELVKYLEGKGYDQFSMRRLSTLEPWQSAEITVTP